MDSYKTRLMQAIARGWCAERNENKLVDNDLASAICTEIMLMPAEPNLGCATTAELIDEIRGRIELDGKLDYRTVDHD